METSGYVESFLDYADAFMFLENHLIEYRGWDIQEAGVRYVNHHWQVYVTFQRKIGGDDAQAHLPW